MIFIPTVGAIADFWSPAAFSSPTNLRTTVRTACEIYALGNIDRP